MADKKKKGRRAYLSDYILDVSGEYVYKGEYYTAQLQGRQFLSLAGKILAFVASAEVLLVAAGCLSTGSSSGAFYVTLPHVVAIVLCAVCIYDAVTVLKSKGKVKSHDYEKGVMRLKSLSIAAAACSIGAAAGQLVYLFTAESGDTLGADITFFALALAAFGVILVTIQLQNRIIWQKYT